MDELDFVNGFLYGVTGAEKPAFKKAFKTHRCLVMMSGFFEWKRENGNKQPFYFKHPDGKPLAVAALWDTWQGESDSEIASCTILTTSANNLMEPIHGRMPLMLNRDKQAVWLDHSHYDQNQLKSLLTSCPDDELTKYPVTPKINQADFEGKSAVMKINV